VESIVETEVSSKTEAFRSEESDKNTETCEFPLATVESTDCAPGTDLRRRLEFNLRLGSASSLLLLLLSNG